MTDPATGLKPNDKFTVSEIMMALTLVKYVSGDDISLPRKEFLQMVADRINDDLKSKVNA